MSVCIVFVIMVKLLLFLDNNMWNFFTPWEHLPEVSTNGTASTVANFTFGNNQPSGLNKWFQQVSGNTVAEKMNNLQKAMLVDCSGPKKLSGMKVVSSIYNNISNNIFFYFQLDFSKPNFSLFI